jgi:hypothetical protein
MPSSQIPAELRRIVKLRANNNCEYFQALGNYSFHPFPVDHIIPTSKGGSDDYLNLANTCQFCNGSKFNRTEAIDPMTGETVLLFNPRTHQWKAHFLWSEDFTKIIGITPIGRATVACLKMILASTLPICFQILYKQTNIQV